MSSNNSEITYLGESPNELTSNLLEFINQQPATIFELDLSPVFDKGNDFIITKPNLLLQNEIKVGFVSGDYPTKQ